MRKTQFLAVLAALTIFLTSCITREEKCRKWGVCGTKSDSLVYIEKLTTDTFIQDDSQVWIDMLLACDSTGEVYIDKIDRLETDNSNLQFKLDNNKIYVYVKKPSDTIYKDCKEVIKYQKVKDIVKVNELKTWQKVLMWLGVLLIISVVIFVLLKIKKIL